MSSGILPSRAKSLLGFVLETSEAAFGYVPQDVYLMGSVMRQRVSGCPDVDPVPQGERFQCYVDNLKPGSIFVNNETIMHFCHRDGINLSVTGRRIPALWVFLPCKTSTASRAQVWLDVQVYQRYVRYMLEFIFS